MPLKIFSEKKSLIAGRKVIFYIIAGVAMSIAFLILAWIIPVSQSEIAIIPVGLEDYVLSQRFFFLFVMLCPSRQGNRQDISICD